jgi:hypothetical protein
MKLLGYLLNNGRIATGNKSQAGNGRFQGFGDTEAFDIKAAATEQAGDPGKHSRFILKKYGNCMFHLFVLCKVDLLRG